MYRVLKRFTDGRVTLSDIRFNTEAEAQLAVIYYSSFVIANRDVESYSIVQELATTSIQV